MTAQRARDPGSPLVGMFLHTLEPNGRIGWQGRILAVEGEQVLVQLYSWLDGAPTKVAPLARADVLSDRCLLYATATQWLDGYDDYCARRQAQGDPLFRHFDRDLTRSLREFLDEEWRLDVQARRRWRHRLPPNA